MLQLRDIDYWWKELTCECDRRVEAPTARVQITQPQGYVQRIEAAGEDVEASEWVARIRMRYPLIDEGRYDCSHRTWNGAWEMGEYRFEVVLYDGDREISRDSLELDPHSFFPSDRMPIAVDARPQIIECAPTQPVYINREKAGFVIRIRKQRVSSCSVQVDVTSAGGDSPIAGPWQLSLTDQFQMQQFSIDGWQEGEYWIRVRTIVGTEPVGPYCVRKLWVQVSHEEKPPEVIELGGYPNVMVDDYTLETARGIQFMPVSMEKKPDKALLQIDRDWEDEYVLTESLTWNATKDRYECVYANRNGSIERSETHEQRQHMRMLLISEDGEDWHKPSLGLVEFNGSGDNNILTDLPDETGEQDKAHDIEYAEFEFYDAGKHGQVALENVFLASGKRTHFPFECKSLQTEEAAAALRDTERDKVAGMRDDGLGVMDIPGVEDDPDVFRPRPGEFWPMEKRGDMYVVLTREPMICLGVGMDLRHTTEIIHFHAEQTGTDGPTKLLWYFRPGAPPYPPHGATYDNMHLCLRCLGVLWTEDGLNYKRQFMLETDEHDPVGTQFYCMGLLGRMGNSGESPGRAVLKKIESATNGCEAFPTRSLYLGTALVHWGIEQVQAPELIWTRDMLHFHRFQGSRRSLIERGAWGTYNAGMLRDRHQYCEFGDSWWYPYIAVNTRHNGYAVLHKFANVEALQQQFPNHADAPYFPTWDAYFLDGKQTRYLPALARCKPFRVACAEPSEVDGRGELTTRPILVDGKELTINAATDHDGWIDVTIIGPGGQALLDTQRFQGDSTNECLADLTEWQGQAIRIQFKMRNARMYAFTISSP